MGADDRVISLDDFAPTGGRRQCSACAAPQDARTEFEAARKADPKRFTYRVISAWLTQVWNIEVSEDSLRRHFGRGHV